LFQYRQIGTSFAVEQNFGAELQIDSPNLQQGDNFEYSIESIVTHRANEYGEMEFKVHWTGTSSNDDEWFDRATVADEYPQMVTDYEAKHMRPQSRARRRGKKDKRPRTSGWPRTSGGESMESGGRDEWADMQEKEEQLQRAREAQARIEVCGLQVQ
jgi:hypothetical protein